MELLRIIGIFMSMGMLFGSVNEWDKANEHLDRLLKPGCNGLEKFREKCCGSGEIGKETGDSIDTFDSFEKRFFAIVETWRRRRRWNRWSLIFFIVSLALLLG